ncbi:hypothetical protein [Reichenbachiella versicolor]|uniref:hypothetical protein n=1 Tax=Reichenbachiella versicolor TaxID=1821036 RepID=UPI0013A581D5|nr:hypothetical protein [Reichenbachiella versicolor]
MASCQTSYRAKYKERSYPRHDRKYPVFFTHQHVWVFEQSTGKEVECIVRGRVSKRKYFVRKYKSRKQGTVHEKRMRAISDEEMDALRLNSGN